MNTPRTGTDRGRARRPGHLATGVVAVLVVAPLLVLIVRAFADVWRAPALLPQQWGLRGVSEVLAGGSRTALALANSVVVATATTAVALGVGWQGARAVGARRRPRPALLVVMVLPLLVPEFVTGTGLAAWFLRLGLADTLPGLVLAHLVVVLPYVVLLLAPGFTREVREREEAARVLGAGPLHRLRLVTLPAVAPALATASLVGFLVSLSQYGTSLAVGGGRPMLPLLLVPFVRDDSQIAAALALALLLPAALALAAAMRFVGFRPDHHPS